MRAMSSEMNPGLPPRRERKPLCDHNPPTGMSLKSCSVARMNKGVSEMDLSTSLQRFIVVRSPWHRPTFPDDPTDVAVKDHS